MSIYNPINLRIKQTPLIHCKFMLLIQMISFQLFFKSRGILNEEGFVLFVRKNAIIVLIPKFGLEGTVFFDTKDKAAPNLVFDEEVYTSIFYR